MTDEREEDLPVKFADECRPCSLCGEPWCDDCEQHYADCDHPGPHSEEEEESGNETP